jgi:transcriptional regulator with XRE-family HTH domain
MKFGEYLRLLRLENEITLREFAKKTGIDVAYLSRLERSIILPPQKREIIDNISKTLGLDSDQRQKLNELANLENGKYPNDLKDKISQMEAIPILLRTINNKKLTDEEIKKLAERINKEYK